MSFAAKAIAASLALACTLVASTALSAYRLCALRDGPNGPCSCEVEGGKPGEFKTVGKGFCQKVPPKPAAVDKSKPTAAPVTSEPAQADNAEQSGVRAEPQAAKAAAANPRPPAEAAPSASPKLAEVRSRGKLLCGVNSGLLGFSMRTPAGQWAGLDADFCRAVAAAVFGDGSKVEFVPIETSERFSALQSGRIDLLSRNTTWTMDRDVDMGLDFAGVLYFDGQGFLTSDERGLVSAQQLAGAKVCVEGGTTSESNMAYYFKSHSIGVDIRTFPTHGELLQAYKAGTCDAYSGDRSSLFSDRAGFPDREKHAVLPEVISKEPLGPAVLQGDRGWAEIVRWTLAGLINAEEVGLGKTEAATSGEAKADIQRLLDGAGKSGEKLGLSKTWLRETIAAVGNYGEIFDTNVGSESPLGMERGINALWKRGGILYAPPMW